MIADPVEVLQSQMQYVYAWMTDVHDILKRAGLVHTPEAIEPEATEEAQA